MHWTIAPCTTSVFRAAIFQPSSAESTFGTIAADSEVGLTVSRWKIKDVLTDRLALGGFNERKGKAQ